MYENIKNRPAAMALNEACLALNSSRHAYDNWLQQPTAKNDAVLLNSIRDIAVEFPGYGYRRITRELHRQEIIMNHKKVLETMRKHGLMIKTRKKFRPQTTDSNHNHQVYPNLVKSFTPTALNQLWVADITYVALVKGFVYLAVIIDRFSRKCIGWELNRTLETELSLTALQKALATRKHMGINGLIHHSDRGVQYACKEYITLLQQHNIQPSMSRKANPYDNAFAESFIKTLKTEAVYLNEYETLNDAYIDVERFVEEVYNKKRLHSSIGYLPPDEFERGVLKNIGA